MSSEKAKKPFAKKKLIPLIVVAVILVAVLVTVFVLVGNANKFKKNGVNYASGAWEGLSSKSSIYYINIDTSGGYKNDQAKMAYGNSVQDPDLEEENFALKVNKDGQMPLGYWVEFSKQGARWEAFTGMTPVTQNIAMITGDKALAVRKVKDNKTETLVKESLINGSYKQVSHAGSQMPIGETLTIANNAFKDGPLSATITYSEENDWAEISGKNGMGDNPDPVSGYVAETTDDYIVLCFTYKSSVSVYKYERNK